MTADAPSGGWLPPGSTDPTPSGELLAPADNTTAARPGPIATVGIPDLVHYDRARTALAECVRVDDAATIRDMYAKLAAYARIHDNKEMEVHTKEIHLRACIKIGEISLELEKAQGARTDLEPLLTVKKKSDALKDAGISVPTAARYEQLAGGREEQAQVSAKFAGEAYFAEARATEEPATMAGLRKVIKDAVIATIGEPEPKKPRKQTEPEAPEAELQPSRAWVEWAGAITVLSKSLFNPDDLSAMSTGFVEDLLGEARAAQERLATWISLLEGSIEAATLPSVEEPAP